MKQLCENEIYAVTGGVCYCLNDAGEVRATIRATNANTEEGCKNICSYPGFKQNGYTAWRLDDGRVQNIQNDTVSGDSKNAL